jgi:branched-chain amino acid transport system substrate-binding protein
MLKSIQGVVEEANAAGGARGRRIALSHEDDQTNPDAAVRAARKLIDVDRVAAIMGTWASAVTTAVAPLCWENRVALFTVSGSDTITALPHQGFIFRTQPISRTQINRAADWLIGKGARRVFHLAAQSPFAPGSQEVLSERMRAAGGAVTGYIVYERDKTAFRSEVDQLMRSRSDTVLLNGYLPDVMILLRELYRAGFDGRRFTFAYAANDRTLAGLPHEVTNGLVTFQPSPDLDSPAYRAVQRFTGTQEPDPYSCQTYDHACLAILAAAAAGEGTGVAIRDAVRRISQGDGQKVTSVGEGLRLLADGKTINFEGASGPCDFDEHGDIRGTKFRFEVAEAGRWRVLELS